MFQVRTVRVAGGLMAAAFLSVPVGAAVAPDRTSPLAQKEFRHPAFHIQNRVQRIDEQPVAARQGLTDSLADLHASAQTSYLDVRSGRWATLYPTQPLLPGSGDGNAVSWEGLGVEAPVDARGWERASWDAFRAYVEGQSRALGVDLREMPQGRVTVHEGGAIVQIHTPRVFEGIVVRDSYLSAVVNHGNLVLFGANQWGTIRTPSRPTVGAEQARAAVASHVQLAPSDWRRQPSLAYVVLASGDLESAAATPDSGYDYRLVWVLSPRFAGDYATWEALVDAHSGELLAFQDTNHYQSVRRVQGGVQPVSNDGVPPDGVEQPGWPFPFADVATPSGNVITDIGGNLPVCAAGSITSTLNGPFVRMADVCGPISLASTGNLDFGTSGGTNCTTPGVGGLGNTHSSRTGFFELNNLIAQAKGHLPNNPWLYEPLTANMNINLTCNAFWGGGSVNFYRQGGGCNNTGEIAAIFDHEWGHGMDDNDANGVISNPGEGIADIYMALRLKESCMGRNFRNTNCGGYGNPCVACTGVRDIDWAQRAANTPTTVTWIDANCGGGPAPCGGGVHCEGAVYAESLWDYFVRDLPTIMAYSTDTALEVATRTTYIAAGPVGNVFQCVQGSGGCPATSAYPNFLAADDDNGNLTDGTPHMAALFSAFNRHGIACATPAVAVSGCPGAPTAAPVVTITPGDRGASLSWASVPGAVKYRVYRTDGVFGCDFGKILLGETLGTTWADNGLQNGRQYSYTVAAVGFSSTCLGPMSACAQVTPVAGANLAADAPAATFTITSGDGDAFIDNCENVTVSLPVTNTGTAAQTNVRIAAVQPLSHPGIVIGGTSAPVPLATRSAAVLGFGFRAVDVAADQPIRFRVDYTSDQLSPAVRSSVVVLNGTEGDNQFVASQVYDFETNTQGWAATAGTFNRTNAAPGGAGGAGTFYYQSSTFLDNQCDEVVSPTLSLTATSTLSLQNNYNIEPFSAGSWYDRANVGLLSPSGVRTVVSPSSGRPYNASGPGGVCGQNNTPGWADVNATWGASSWTSGALGLPGSAGSPLRLSIKYGTDGAANNFGFRFDQLTLTNFNLKIADAQTDQCAAGNQPPVAVPDSSNSPTLAAVTIDVLVNDTDPNAGQCLRIASVTNPTNGSVQVNYNSCVTRDTVTYIPSLSCGLPCSDSFQYTVTDQNGGTATATVSVSQQPVELQGFKVE
jgi:Bacterial Ig domain